MTLNKNLVSLYLEDQHTCILYLQLSLRSLTLHMESTITFNHHMGRGVLLNSCAHPYAVARHVHVPVCISKINIDMDLEHTCITCEANRCCAAFWHGQFFLTHWGLYKRDSIYQTFSNAFPWKIFFHNSIRILLKFVPMCPIVDESALVKVMALCQTGDKPLLGPIPATPFPVLLWCRADSRFAPSQWETSLQSKPSLIGWVQTQNQPWWCPITKVFISSFSLRATRVILGVGSANERRH